MCGAKDSDVDSGIAHHSRCYCDEDQGYGYTFSDEYGSCEFCQGLFEEGTIICFDESNVSRICPDPENVYCPDKEEN